MPRPHGPRLFRQRCPGSGRGCGRLASSPVPAAAQASPAHRKGWRGGCGLQVASGSHVECPPHTHLCVPFVCRALRTTRGIGTSEPYLLFLKKSLITFCNCTVDKCPKIRTLAWKIPQTEETSRLQSMGLQRVGHDPVTSLSFSF